MNYQSKEKSTVQVRYLSYSDERVSDFHQAARSLAKTWCTEGNQCNRKCVQGGMKHFGVKKGAGNVKYFCFSSTQHNKKKTNKIFKDLNILAEKLSLDVFPDVHKDIHDKMQKLEKSVPDSLGGKSGLCTEITQSQNSLITESHVDQDISKCFSIWSVEEGHNEAPSGWYFVLPYLTCTVEGKQYYGVAIRLCHGAAIEWNGRIIFHCTSGPTDKSVNGIGTFFGLTVV